MLIAKEGWFQKRCAQEGDENHQRQEDVELGVDVHVGIADRGERLFS